MRGGIAALLIAVACGGGGASRPAEPATPRACTWAGHLLVTAAPKHGRDATCFATRPIDVVLRELPDDGAAGSEPEPTTIGESSDGADVNLWSFDECKGELTVAADHAGRALYARIDLVQDAATGTLAGRGRANVHCTDQLPCDCDVRIVADGRIEAVP